MGTDIYLCWNGMTKEDEEKQITGFDITKGDKGYLRASIGMIIENLILREVFEEKYWESTDPLEYDFKTKCLELPFLLKKYLLTKIEIELIMERREIPENLREFLEKIDLLELSKEPKLTSGMIKDIVSTIKWANSLIDFFLLGIKKQEEGKNPKILISW